MTNINEFREMLLNKYRAYDQELLNAKERLKQKESTLKNICILLIVCAIVLFIFIYIIPLLGDRHSGLGFLLCFGLLMCALIIYGHSKSLPESHSSTHVMLNCDNEILQRFFSNVRFNSMPHNTLLFRSRLGATSCSIRYCFSAVWNGVPFVYTYGTFFKNSDDGESKEIIYNGAVISLPSKFGYVPGCLYTDTHVAEDTVWRDNAVRGVFFYSGGYNITVTQYIDRYFQDLNSFITILKQTTNR